MICNNVMTYNQPDTVHKAAKRLLHIPVYNLWPCSDGQISAPVPTISNYGELILKFIIEVTFNRIQELANE